MQPLEPMPLPVDATFDDLVFRTHPDGREGHFQALHVMPNGGRLSVTLGGMNFGEPGAPYEAMTPDGEIHAPLTPEAVTTIMCSCG